MNHNSVPYLGLKWNWNPRHSSLQTGKFIEDDGKFKEPDISKFGIFFCGPLPSGFSESEIGRETDRHQDDDDFDVSLWFFTQCFSKMNFLKPNEEENNHRVDDDEYEEELDFEADDDIPREEDEDFESDDDYNPVKVRRNHPTWWNCDFYFQENGKRKRKSASPAKKSSKTSKSSKPSKKKSKSSSKSKEKRFLDSVKRLKS